VQLSEVLSILRRWWLALVVTAVIAGLCGYLLGGRAPESYAASSRLIVGPINTDAQTLKAAGQIGQTYAELATSEPIVAGVIAKLGLQVTAGELTREISASANEVTRLLTIKVSNADPKAAVRIADELAGQLQAVSRRDGQRPEGDLQIVQPASVPTSPANTSPLLIVIMAAMAGLVAAAGGVVLIEYARDAVHDTDDLGQLEGVQVLGAVVSGDKGLPIVVTSPNSAEAVAYRLLTTKVALSGDKTRVRSILVFGAEPGRDAAAVGLNMAASISALGIPATVLDAYVGIPEVTSRLNLAGLPGLADLLRSPQSQVDRLERTVAPRLNVIPAGVKPSAVETHPDSAAAAIDAVNCEAGVAVIVAAPLEREMSTVVWAKAVDVAVIVAVKGAKRSLVREAAEALRLIGVPLAGVVLAERRRFPVLRPRTSDTGMSVPLAVASPVPPARASTMSVDHAPDSDSADDYWTRLRPKRPARAAAAGNHES
jgi:tyrosine-protein kinase